MIVAAFGYFLAHEVSFLFPDASQVFMAIWPAAGVGLAAFLLLPRRSWPLLAFSLFLTGNLANLLAGRPPLASLGFMTADILESWLSALLIQAWDPRGEALRRIRGISALFAAAILVNAATASLGAATATLVSGSAFGPGWVSWWIADGLGLLLITPLILAWRDLPSIRKWLSIPRTLEFLAFAAGWSVFSWICFNENTIHSFISPHPYVLVILIAWPALRLGPRGLSLALLVLAILGVTSEAVTTGPSPFGGDDRVQRLLYLESFIASIVIMAWFLSATLAESRDAKRAAEENSERLKSLGDNIPNGFVYELLMKKDGSHRFTYVSEGFSKLTGLDPALVLADASVLYDRIHPEERDELAEAEGKARATLTDFQATLRFRHRNSGWIWIQLSSTPRLLPGGDILWSGIQTDISEQKAIEAELRANEERLRTILNSASDGIFITDADLRYLDVNEAGCALVGYSKEELLRIGIPDLAETADLGRNPLPLEDLRAGRPARWERVLVRKDGSKIEVEISAKALANGQVVGIARDVTERRWKERLGRIRIDISERALTEDLEPIVQTILDEAEAVTGSAIGFYHFLDDDQENLLLQCWSTKTVATMCGTGVANRHYAVEEAGVWVEAIRQRRPVIHNDYESLPDKHGLPAGHAPIVRELVVPIFDKGKIFAVIGVGNKTGWYDERDIARLVELGEVSRDTIERKRYHEALAETEEGFASVFQGSPLATTLTRSETGLIIDANAAAQRLFGFTREELIGHSTIELGIFEDPAIRTDMLKAVKDRGMDTLETKFRKKNGDRIDVIASVRTIHIKGELILVTQILDISERLRIERAYKESEERFATIFRSSPLPTTLVRIESGEFLDLNDASLLLYGYAREEIVGKTTQELGLYENPQDREKMIAELREDGKPVTLETRLRKKSGELFDALVIAEIVHVEGEHYLVVQIQDFTERNKAQETSARALAEKEVLIRELYHRANNNMQVIAAILEFQAEAIGDPRLSRAIVDTQDRIGSIALVNRKLYEAQDLSHINLKHYIRDLAAIVARGYEDAKVTLDLEADLDDVYVLVDTAIPCGLILNELIGNVYKHAYPEGGEGSLAIRLSRAGDQTITIVVADRGVGVPEGFNLMQATHIGLHSIVGLCAAQLRGQVRFDTRAGLTCTISFKDNIYEARV